MENQTVIRQIYKFIHDYVEEDENVVVPVSGGVDSDVVSRLCVGALGPERVSLFFVFQDDQEKKFYDQARGLAEKLGVKLSGFHLEGMNRKLLDALRAGDVTGTFRKAFFLDEAKMKCSLRTAVLSAYQDKGYLIAGSSNRSERELGLMMTFGDNIANFKPIAHLYKTEVMELAEALGTSREVLETEPSAGFWKGQTDLEDIAYWMVNRGPILMQRSFSPEEEETVNRWKGLLSYPKLDNCLRLFRKGSSVKETAGQEALPEEMVEALNCLVIQARKYKTRKVLVEPEQR